MRVSVVINTYNRGPSLRRTLDSFRYLNHDAFEVIVVNGPSTDDTDAVLEEYRGRIKIGRCPEVNISKSRNAGHRTDVRRDRRVHRRRRRPGARLARRPDCRV